MTRLPASDRSVGRVLITVLVAALASFWLMPAHSAFAQGQWHGYSAAYEASGSGFIGVRQYRPNRLPTNIPATGCSTPIAGSPVYQTQWVQDSDAQDWVEIGTGHQCNREFRYHFAAYASNGNFTLLDYIVISSTNNSSHTFSIRRDLPTTTWRFEVDTLLIDTLNWNRTFGDVAVGLESYVQNAGVSRYSGQYLRWRKSDDVWHQWGGQDGTNVNSVLMCGSWILDTEWEAGQNANC